MYVCMYGGGCIVILGWWKAEAIWLGAVVLPGNPLSVNYQQGRFSPGMAAPVPRINKSSPWRASDTPLVATSDSVLLLHGG